MATHQDIFSEETAGGALGGAATGATIGSVFPGAGTLIGAGVGALAGGLGGMFSAKSRRKAAEAKRKANEEAMKRLQAASAAAYQQRMADMRKALAFYDVPTQMLNLRAQMPGVRHPTEMPPGWSGSPKPMI